MQKFTQSGMSALGQKQTYAVQKGMSALPPKADINCGERYVCFVSKADIAVLFLGNNFTRVRNQPGHPL